jgi:polar amino acid transport system ATP-binding protein
MRPRVLMLDEVTAALDPVLTAEVLEVVRELKSQERALIVVTHHLDFASAVGDTLIFLWEGRIRETGRPREMLARPQSPELRDFLGVIRRVN